MVLSSLNLCEYKSPSAIDDLEVPFLRVLETQNNRATPCCPYLESPNIAAGLPAQGWLIFFVNL